MSTTDPSLPSNERLYHSAPKADNSKNRAVIEVEPESQRSSKSLQDRQRSWLRTIAIQTFFLLWIGPVVALLVLNFKGHVIGVSAWCPNGRCWADVFNNQSAVAESNVGRFTRESKDFNGLMQLVAKALELWFDAITGAMMYLAVMYVAGSTNITLRLLTLPREYHDPITVLDRTFWNSLAKTGRLLRSRLTCLVVLAIFLGILSNIMGPATALLAIPTLQWITTPTIGGTYFGYIHAPIAPLPTGFAFHDSGCSEAEFKSRNYSCTAGKWGVALDAWSGSFMASYIETPPGNDDAHFITSQQGDVSLSFNATGRGSLGSMVWVQSRQAVDQLSTDRQRLVNVSRGATAGSMAISNPMFKHYTACNQSLDVQLNRLGPIMGTSPNYWIPLEGGSWKVNIDANRSLQCFSSYHLVAPPDVNNNNFTRCIQLGTGWPQWPERVADRVSFTIAGTPGANHSYGVPITAKVSNSNQIVLLPNGSLETLNGNDGLPNGCIYPSNFSSLLTVDVDPALGCDWAYLFNYTYNHFSYSNLTSASNTIEFVQVINETEMVFAVDFVAFLSFTSYQLDPSPLNNPLRLVQTPYLTPSSLNFLNESRWAGFHGVQLNIDPTWTFAAWSVDWVNGVVPSSRIVAQMMHDVFHILWWNLTSETPELRAALDAATRVPVLQTLSLVDYDTSTSPPPPGEKGFHPRLHLSANIYVWAYGDDSKMAKLEYVVAIAGCVVAAFQFVFGFVVRRKQRSLTQLLVAALACSNASEFSAFGHGEDDEARTLLRVVDSEEAPGKLKIMEAT